MLFMRFRRIINKPISIDEDGIHVVGGINVAVSAAVNEPRPTRVSTKQKVRIVQRNGHTEIHEETTTTEGSAAED